MINLFEKTKPISGPKVLLLLFISYTLNWFFSNVNAACRLYYSYRVPVVSLLAKHLISSIMVSLLILQLFPIVVKWYRSYLHVLYSGIAHNYNRQAELLFSILELNTIQPSNNLNQLQCISISHTFPSLIVVGTCMSASDFPKTLAPESSFSRTISWPGACSI